LSLEQASDLLPGQDQAAAVDPVAGIDFGARPDRSQVAVRSRLRHGEALQAWDWPVRHRLVEGWGRRAPLRGRRELVLLALEAEQARPVLFVLPAEGKPFRHRPEAKMPKAPRKIPPGKGRK